MAGETTHELEGETTRGRNDAGRTGKWAKRPVTTKKDSNLLHRSVFLITSNNDIYSSAEGSPIVAFLFFFYFTFFCGVYLVSPVVTNDAGFKKKAF